MTAIVRKTETDTGTKNTVNVTATVRKTETVTVRFKWLRPPLSKRDLQIILRSAYEYTCVGAPYCTRENNILV